MVISNLYSISELVWYAGETCGELAFHPGGISTLPKSLYAIVTKTRCQNFLMGHQHHLENLWSRPLCTLQIYMYMYLGDNASHKFWMSQVPYIWLVLKCYFETRVKSHNPPFSSPTGITFQCKQAILTRIWQLFHNRGTHGWLLCVEFSDQLQKQPAFWYLPAAELSHHLPSCLCERNLCHCKRGME